jgi:preprotein translocase subunit YajC
MTQFPLFAAAQQTDNPLGMLVPMVLVFVMFYFVAIRPQKKRQAELTAQINSVQGGDTIITNGGIYGLVVSVSEKTLTLKIADNVKIKLDKMAVATVVKKDSDAAKSADGGAEAPEAA